MIELVTRCAFCNHNLAVDGSCVKCEGFDLSEEIEIADRKIIGKPKRVKGQNLIYRVKMFRTPKEWDAVMEQARRTSDRALEVSRMQLHGR